MGLTLRGSPTRRQPGLPGARGQPLRCPALPRRTIAVKLATWNVNSLAVRLPQVLDWLRAAPDVLVLQETKLTDDKFPHAEIEAAGWQRAVVRPEDLQRRGAAQPHPAVDVVRNIPGFADEQARVIAATVGGVRVIGAYFPNGQAPGSDKFAYKMRWLDALRDWVREPSWPPPASGADGRLQHRPRRPRRVRPGGLGRPDPLHATRSARTSRPASDWACTTPSGSSSSRPRAGAGGTTATWPSARTRACASTTSWSARRCAAGAACAIDKAAAQERAAQRPRAGAGFALQVGQPASARSGHRCG
jgi:hypothetical protein